MEEDKPTSKSNLIQTKLTNMDSSTPGVSQKLADKVIINFIIDTVQPLSLVDNDSFIKMINTFSPRTKIFCRQTLMARILESFKEMKESLILNLSDVSYVCTTADCWTHNRRAYLGVTAHWIDPKNLKRKSVALALKRIIGCQTYDILSNIIAEIHRSYKIQNKVCKMITDNGSNFLKAFRIFGEDNNNNNTSNIPDKNIEDGEQEEDDEMEFEIIDVHDILGSSIKSSMLPSHHRCSCHNLNLIATVDAEEALLNEDFKRVSRSTFSKCQALWNKQNKSSKTSDIFKKKLGRYLLTPNTTRWNSVYNAMKLLALFLDEKKMEMNYILDQMGIQYFNVEEHTFIKEYTEVMQYVAASLKILEGQDNMSMGYYVPTLSILIIKLKRINNLKFCQPLIESMLKSIEKRFPDLYDDDNVIAAIVHPSFKYGSPVGFLPIKDGLLLKPTR
ncbi:uncharacterized protein LOC135924151 [Gordionus sp. m RMFG-2023]|uniref:uncharacterized protein LOC135924151 n=1 Tax=Gordionus sp. m RMFG-2023 TaxID=3053472 RepID=UPI0031FE040D